jgi:hypothetical protein
LIEDLVIDGRFRGPPESGNGGYVCGLLGRHYPDGATVTLRKPPPLGVELTLAGHGAGRLRLQQGDELIAEAEPGSPDLEPPIPPEFGVAVEAAKHYVGFVDHHFSECFVCGTDRSQGDGLRIYAGPWEDEGMVAAPWIPDQTLADDQGLVRPEFLWAALDCPGYFALHIDRRPQLMLLGRFTARVETGICGDERCVVVGWPLGEDGRKRYAGTALYSESRGLVGSARATWIALDRSLW